MYRTLESLQKQSRLPKRTAPRKGILDDFKVSDMDVNSFIEQEKKRLFREKEVPQDLKPIKNISPTKLSDLSNRPRNQKSLADFSNPPSATDGEKWWKPVLDGTLSQSRHKEEQVSEAAQTEVLANSLENETHSCLTIDHREANSTLPAMLKLHGHQVIMQSLPVGDIRISDRILIERKTARDLIDSIIDGRLVNQAKRLHNAAPRPLLIVESIESERIHPNAIYGAMAWVTLDLGLPVLMTGSAEQTARFISVASKRESRILDLLMMHQRKKNIDAEKAAIKAASAEIMNIMGGELTDSPLSKKWNREVVRKRAQILSELPGIGAITAEKIMNKASDIMGLCSLSEQELANIKGVSPLQAKELYKFLHG